MLRPVLAALISMVTLTRGRVDRVGAHEVFSARVCLGEWPV
jgi:hypothetical protein